MNKVSFPVGMALNLGFGVFDSIGSTKQNFKTNRLSQLKRSPSMNNLGPSSSYNFGGGKHTSYKQTQLPHQQMY